jgi:phage shock protein E
MKKLFIFLLLFACSEKQSETVLTPKDFDAKYKSTENAILLDVRTVEEVNAGTLAGAINIVYDNDFVDKLGNLEHKPIFVYCGSGIRSAKASVILKEKGYEVYDMDGGIRPGKHQDSLFNSRINL